MTLKCRENGYDVAVWNGRASLVVDPPFAKSLVRLYPKSLLWQRGFGKCIRHICAIEDDQVLHGCGGLEDT